MVEKKLEPIEIETKDGQKIKVIRHEDFDGFQKEVEIKFQTVQQELDKERAKEKNFKALRAKRLSELTEEQQKELTEKERAIMERAEEVEKKVEEMEKSQRTSWLESAINSLAVESEDDKKNLLANFNRLKDPEDSADAVYRKMQVAYSITFQRPVNTGERTIATAIPFGGGTVPKRSGQNYGETDAGKGLASKLGMNFVKEKKQ